MSCEAEKELSEPLLPERMKARVSAYGQIRQEGVGERRLGARSGAPAGRMAGLCVGLSVKALRPGSWGWGAFLQVKDTFL